MKKLLLAFAFAGMTAGLSAQTFSVVDNSSANITGTTQNYYIANNALDTRVYTVHNLTGSAATIKVRKTIVTLADPGASAYFCTDQNCYSPGQTLSLNVNMASGGQFLLTCDYDPYSANGLSTVRYAIIDQSNMDSVTVVFNYNVTPAGVNNQSLVKASVSNPMPNPAASFFMLNYKLGSNNPSDAKVVIYNMLGDKVSETSISDPEGNVRIDVSTLGNGVYFCSLESGGKALATKRLVVSH